MRFKTMPRSPKTLRLSVDLEAQLQREFARRGIQEWSAGVVELLSEAIRMRSVPGIGFTDSVTGRRPVIAGTGIEVWEIIAMLKSVKGDEGKLSRAFHWLTPVQMRAAVAYYKLYPEEIDRRIALDESWTPDRIRREMGFTALGPGLRAVKR